MRKLLLLTGMLATVSTVDAVEFGLGDEQGFGVFYGEFSATEPTSLVQPGWYRDWRRARDSDGNYGEYQLIADTRPESWDHYGEGYIDDMDNNAYRWGVERVGSFNEDSETGDQTWHYDYTWSENNLSFQGAGFIQQAKGEEFVAGMISYTNGVSRIGSNPQGASLNIMSFAFDNFDFVQLLEIEIAIDTSPNSIDGNPLSQALAADYIYFPMFPEFGSLRVFEGETGTVEILAEFNSLHFKGFGEVLTPDTAFLNASIETSLVPIPAAVWFFCVSLLGLAGMRRKIEEPSKLDE